MNTDKIAISMPSDMLSVIDRIRTKRGVSRSKFITLLLREKLMDEQEREVRAAYDRVFSDPAVAKEQLETAAFLDGTGKEEGQEW
jgi:metal-responsive CopG/Arc/MetJ family transcriptional regulator